MIQTEEEARAGYQRDRWGRWPALAVCAVGSFMLGWSHNWGWLGLVIPGLLFFVLCSEGVRRYEKDRGLR